MNCQAIQNQILALPDPRELPEGLHEHVDACPACRAWAQQAARLESLLEQLPVPAAPGEKKEAMIGELMQADPVIQPMAVLAARPPLPLVAVRFLRRNANSAAGLAAAVLVAVGISWFASRPNGTKQSEPALVQKHPLLEKMVARDAALARATSDAQKLEVLGGMADDLATDTRGMARLASGAELKQMAGWYEKVVREGMVKRAESLPDFMPAAEKAKLLTPLASKLAADAAEADKLSQESPPDAQPALKRLADAAREGEKSLRAIARGGK